MKGEIHMKKLFVAAPFKYGMNDEELNAYFNRLERLAYEAEQEIGEYCEIVERPFSTFPFVDHENNNHDKKGINIRLFIADAVKNMCAADCAVFSDDWRTSKECSMLHTVAQELGITILEVFG